MKDIKKENYYKEERAKADTGNLFVILFINPKKVHL